MKKIQGQRVLVTGGAGFIGSHVVEALLRRGNEVIVLDDFSTGKRSNLAQSGHAGRLIIKQADIRREKIIAPIFKKIDIVFHLACRNVRLSLSQPSLVHDVNATGTLNVLKAAAAAKVKRFLYCSSSEVNGTAEKVPMNEDYFFRPETVYGASKLAGEYYAQVFQRSGWLSTVIARPHNTYGPREHYEGDAGEVIPRFILWALMGKPPVIYGKGTQTRDFTYVTETAEFLIKLAECDAAVGNTYNICRGEEVSVLEIAEIICEFAELKARPVHISDRPSDVLRLCGDPSRLRRLLGSSPEISIREGLRQTMEWFRRHIRLTRPLVRSLKSENWRIPKRERWLSFNQK